MAIKVVLFDVDKTIMYYDVENLYREIEKFNGTKFSAAKKYIDHLNDLVDSDRMSEKEFGSRIVKQFRLPERFADYRSFYMKGKYRMRPWKRMYKLVNDVHRRYKTGTLTNVGPERNRLRRGMLNGAKFDYFFNSFELKAFKPEKKIFIAVLNKLKVKPNEVVFIDDKEKNAVAARRLGIKGVRFTGVAKLRKDLRKLGIKC